MKRMTQIIGMPAVRDEDGAHMGSVEKLCLQQSERKLAGLAVRKEGHAKKTYVQLRDVRLIGEKAVVVKKGCRMSGESCLWRPGMKVLTTQGEQLGWMTDALIDEKDGGLRAVEVSLGLWDDFMQGRVWIEDFTLRPCGVIVAWQEDAIGREGEL